MSLGDIVASANIDILNWYRNWDGILDKRYWLEKDKHRVSKQNNFIKGRK